VSVAEKELTGSDTGFFENYAGRLGGMLAKMDWTPVQSLAADLLDCWRNQHRLFICGNGGSAANAMHIANDLLYGVSKLKGNGLRAEALPVNGSIVTCLANDVGYENIFSYQIAVQAQAQDLLLVLSGSGNSPNILKALEQARQMDVKSYAILGFSGGKAKELADVSIHFPIDDMQISEDTQLVVAHMVMQWLYQNRPAEDGDV
jgi:D-sedoheptulose 7-phosphate isomerase